MSFGLARSQPPWLWPLLPWAMETMTTTAREGFTMIELSFGDLLVCGAIACLVLCALATMTEEERERRDD